MQDRLDGLDVLLRSDVGTWATLVHSPRTEGYELKIDPELVQANATATLLKQLLASLRLPGLLWSVLVNHREVSSLRKEDDPDPRRSGGEGCDP